LLSSFFERKRARREEREKEGGGDGWGSEIESKRGGEKTCGVFCSPKRPAREWRRRVYFFSSLAFIVVEFGESELTISSAAPAGGELHR